MSANLRSIIDIDKEIQQEIVQDLISGIFYTECDDETLEIALQAMFESPQTKAYWRSTGVILGDG